MRSRWSPVEMSWHTVTHGRGSEGETGERSGYPVFFTLPRNMVYPALLPLMHTPRLPVVDWTDAPADLNGLVRFADTRNLVSARVPSHFNLPLRQKSSCNAAALSSHGDSKPLLTTCHSQSRMTVPNTENPRRAVCYQNRPVGDVYHFQTTALMQLFTLFLSFTVSLSLLRVYFPWDLYMTCSLH